jgi:hypothetical protein
VLLVVCQKVRRPLGMDPSPFLLACKHVEHVCDPCSCVRHC